MDAEIQRLLDEGTLEPVESSEWAAPIVAVLKGDKTSIRICGDFRVTINPVSKLDRYPIPKVEDLFATLQKGETLQHWMYVSHHQHLVWKIPGADEIPNGSRV